MNHMTSFLVNLLFIPLILCACTTVQIDSTQNIAVAPSPHHVLEIPEDQDNDASWDDEALAYDPWEKFNRSVFTFNEKLDQVVLKPIAIAYKKWLPSFIRTGVANFFGNLSDVWSIANAYLQGEVIHGTEGIMRVAMNSTLGLGGILDISTDAGLKRRPKDFGQTLGVWGVKTGPYLVIPVLGPSNIRDTAAIPANIYGNPWFYLNSASWQYTGTASNFINRRAMLLNATRILDEAALDKYLFVRDVYWQRRQNMIRNHHEESDNN